MELGVFPPKGNLINRKYLRARNMCLINFAGMGFHYSAAIGNALGKNALGAAEGFIMGGLFANAAYKNSKELSLSLKLEYDTILDRAKKIYAPQTAEPSVKKFAGLLTAARKTIKLLCK